MTSCSHRLKSTDGAGTKQTVTATDIVGNTATVESPAISIDRVSPTLQFGAATPAKNESGWNNTDVSIAFSAAAALSGVDPASQSSPLVLSAEGSAVSGNVVVKDKAGNTATLASPVFKIDKTKPTLNVRRPQPSAKRDGMESDERLGCIHAKRHVVRHRCHQPHPPSVIDGGG